MVILANDKEKTIKACDAEPGMLYVITNWTYHTYIGKVVVKYGDKLYQIHSDIGNSWHVPSLYDHESCRLRKLEKGEMLIVD